MHPLRCGAGLWRVVWTAAAVMWACSAQAAGPLPTVEQLQAKGTLMDLPTEHAQLYIPDGVGPIDGAVDVIFHLHGSITRVAEQAEAYRFNTVVLCYSPGGFSSAYRKPFEDGTLFPRLMRQTQDALRRQPRLRNDVRVGRLVVTSFSAGYGAVREMLKLPDIVAAIDGLLLCDSLYASYAGDPELHEVNAEQMQPFVEFAQAAARKEKHFVFSHSYIVPPGYAGTHETADFLAASLGLDWRATDIEGPGTLRRNRVASRGQFALIGATGEDATAHVSHFSEMGFFLEQMGVLRTID